jgi:diacylglycerol O-acyltransferase / wax synthase
MTVERLSGFDTSLLRIEDPRQPMTISLLLELNPATVPGGYTFDTFRQELMARIDAIPEFRMMLADSPFRLGNPVWTHDPSFDVDQHLHRVDLAAPGGRRELSAVVGRLIGVPLDRSRPLWEMYVIEGVAGSGAGDGANVVVLTKIHHSMMDGTSSRDLFSQLFSTDVDPPRPRPVAAADSASRGEIARDGLVRIFRRLQRFLTIVLPASVIAVFKVIRRSANGRGTASLLTAPRTPFNGNITEGRTVAYAEVDLEDVKTVKNAYGVRVNDVMLAVLSGALRRYLLDRSVMPETSLIALMPIGVVEESLSGRNNMSAMFSSMHTNVADPVERLYAIAEATAAAKSVSADIGGTLLRDWTECIPGVLRAAMRLYGWSGMSARRPLFNLTVSNVFGPQRQDYLLGAAVRRVYPLGPVLNGVGLNVSVGSYNGIIGIGLVACADLLPDVWSLADGLPIALKELWHGADDLSPGRARSPMR